MGDEQAAAQPTSMVPGQGPGLGSSLEEEPDMMRQDSTEDLQEQLGYESVGESAHSIKSRYAKAEKRTKCCTYPSVIRISVAKFHGALRALVP